LEIARDVAKKLLEAQENEKIKLRKVKSWSKEWVVAYLQ